MIPNGVPPAPAVQTPRRQVLAELGLPQDARLVGLVGRLWPQKRVKDAIWAADLLKVIRSDVHLLVIGDGPHRARLEKFRDQVEIRDKVLFLGHREDVPRLLPHFDVLWSASAFEGQSNTIMEAMAAGVPVVATDIPGTRDLVVHGTTGYLVPTEGRPATAAAVNTSVARGLAKYTNILLDSPALAQRLGQAARSACSTSSASSGWSPATPTSTAGCWRRPAPLDRVDNPAHRDGMTATTLVTADELLRMHS